MKKVIIIFFAVILMTSFLVVANGNPNSGNGNSQAGNASPNGSPNQEIPLNQSQIQNIVRERNRLRINQSECPANCSCDGSTLKCRLQNGTREMTVYAGNSGNIIFQVKNENASTQVQLFKAEDGKVYAQLKNNETKEIILPDEVKERVRERVHTNETTMALNEDGEYEVQARKRARLLGMIPVQERTRIRLDAETGEIIRERNSWWGFLARDVAESETQ